MVWSQRPSTNQKLEVVVFHGHYVHESGIIEHRVTVHEIRDELIRHHAGEARDKVQDVVDGIRMCVDIDFLKGHI